MNKTRDAYDRWSTNYDIDPNPQRVLEELTVMELVSPRPGDRILDAACGTGRYCRMFQERGADVVGLDFSEGMLHIAQSALPDIDFYLADLMQPLPFPAASFNKVNCAQALKHLPDIGPALAEFARVITAEGTVTFSVTHPDMNWEGYELSFVPSFVLSAESDIHHYGLPDYSAAIAAAGLKIIELRDVTVDDRIREFLTAESFEMVRDRKQIAVFHLVK